MVLRVFAGVPSLCRVIASRIPTMHSRDEDASFAPARRGFDKHFFRQMPFVLLQIKWRYCLQICPPCRLVGQFGQGVRQRSHCSKQCRGHGSCRASEVCFSRPFCCCSCWWYSRKGRIAAKARNSLWKRRAWVSGNRASEFVWCPNSRRSSNKLHFFTCQCLDILSNNLAFLRLTSGQQSKRSRRPLCSKSCFKDLLPTWTWCNLEIIFVSDMSSLSLNIPSICTCKDSVRYRQSHQKPWLNESGERIWSRHRICLAKLVQSQSFETFMGIVIFVNIVLLGEEVQHLFDWQWLATTFLLCCWTFWTLLTKKVILVMIWTILLLEFCKHSLHGVPKADDHWNQLRCRMLSEVCQWPSQLPISQFRADMASGQHHCFANNLHSGVLPASMCRAETLRVLAPTGLECDFRRALFVNVSHYEDIIFLFL